MILSLIVSAFLMARGLDSPVSSNWLAWVALLPLFAAIRTLRPVGAMLCGALWGFCLFSFSLAAGVWDGGTHGGIALDHIARVPLPFASVPLAFLVIIPAAYTFLGSLLTGRIGFSPFVLGVSWMGVELACESLGLRQGLLAGTQGDGVLLNWLGGALGYVLVAFVFAYANSLLLSLLSRVRLATPASRFVTGSVEGGIRIIPQTDFCFPLFALSCSHPRAPPMIAAANL